MQPLVSINIPTYNSGKAIGKCLDSIKNQTYKNVEIIIVDGYSKDHTLKMAKEYGANIYYALGLSEARRLGIEKSKGKYIFFLDSDQAIDSSTTSKCVQECEDNGYDAITLFEQSVITKNSYIEKVIAYDKWLFHSLEDDDAVWGAAIPRFFRAEIFKYFNWPAGLLFMFEHNAIYIELVKKGIEVVFKRDLHIYHYEQNTIAKIYKRFYHYGQSYVPALKKYPKELILHSMPRRTYFTKRAFDRPSLLMGLFFVYILKGIAAALGTITYFLKGMKVERNKSIQHF